MTKMWFWVTSSVSSKSFEWIMAAFSQAAVGAGALSSENEHRGFGRAAPAQMTLDDFGVQRRSRAGQGAGERIDDEVSGGAYGLFGQILEAEIRVMRDDFLHGVHLRLQM